MNRLREMAGRFFPDTPERRQLGVTAGVATVIAGLFFYMYLALRFLPEMGIRMLGGATGFLLLVLTGPAVTFPLYFATTFGTGLSVPGLPVTLNQGLAAGFVFAWVLTLIRQRFVVPMSPVPFLVAAFTMYAVSFGLVYKAPSAPASYHQFVYLVMGLALGSTFRYRAEFLRLVGVLLAITCAISLVGLAEFAIGRDLFPEFSDNTVYSFNLRINGISKNAIQFAFCLTWVLPWALLLHIEGRKPWMRRSALMAMGLIVVLCLLTRNRQSPIIIAAMLAFGLPLVRYARKGRLIGALVLAGVAVAPLVVAKLIERFLEFGGEGRPDMSLMIRRDKFLAAKQMIAESPWTGIGLNNFKDRWWGYRQPGDMFAILYEKGYPHHVDMGYLQILVETGVIGTLFFLLIVLTTVVLWWGTYRAACRFENSFHQNALVAAAMGFVQVGLSMVLQDTFFIPRTYFLFGLLFAVVAMVRMEQRSAEVPGKLPDAPPA